MARNLLVFAGLLALFVLLDGRNVSSEPYIYDEADYMSAARFGFAANWCDAGSMPIADFVRAGLHRNGPRALSERIRGGSDVLFYRHFHGPLFHYLLIPASRMGFSERGVRRAMLAIPVASLAVIYFGCLWLLGGAAAILASALFLTSYSVLGSTEIAPHQLFALLTLACLILLLKAIASRSRAYWYAAIVASALAFCTLEVGFVVVLTVAICAWKEQQKILVTGAFAFVGTVLVVWPAAIFRLSFVKAYAAMAYLALLRGAAWGHEGLAGIWRTRLLESPVEWTIIAITLIAAFRNRAQCYPIVLFAGLMLAVTFRVLSSTPRYSLMFVPPLDMLAGLTLIPSLRISRRPASFAIVALAVAGLYASAWIQVARRPHNSIPRSTAVLTYIHQNELENKALLVPQTDVPTLHYYFPGMRLRGYSGPVSEGVPVLLSGDLTSVSKP